MLQISWPLLKLIASILWFYTFIFIFQALEIQSPCERMIGVYNHLRNAMYFGSITILSFGDRIPREGLHHGK